MDGFLPPIVAELRANITEFQAKMAEARAETQKMAAEGSANFNKLATVGKAALLGLGVAAVAVGVIGVKASMDMEVAHARLVTAVKNTGAQYGAYADDIEHADEKGRGLGFTNEDVETSLAKLVPVTKDVHRAISDVALAEDIARGRHIELGAATDLLTKVENGRVAMLSRVGIQVRDSTGAVISQEEALRRLTDLYGGNASAYAETFSGRLKIIGAEAENVAEQVGNFLIPILLDMGDAVFAGIGWLDDHRVAAAALAVVIGGPLVVAMGAYVVQSGIAVGSSLIDFWTRAYGAATMLAGETLGLAASYEAATVAELVAAGAAEADAVALVTLTAAEEGAAGGALELYAALLLPVAIIGAVVGVAYLAADAFGYWDDATSRATESGGKFARTLVETQTKGLAAADALRVIRGDLHGTEKSYDDVKASQDRLREAQMGGAYTLSKLGLTQQEATEKIKEYQGQLDYLSAQEDVYRGTSEKLRGEVKSLREEHDKAIAQTAVVAQQYGVTIPNATQLSSKELKAMQAAVADATGEFGVMGTQSALNAGLSAGSLAGLTKDAQQFATDIASSIQKATDPFAHFGSQAVVSEGDLEKFFTDSNARAATWADEIRDLINRGVNLGIVQEMAKAGPDSKPALDAFVAMVDEHGVQWVNDVQASSQDAQKAVTDAYDQMALNAAIKSAEIARVTKAYLQDAMVGGSEHLHELMMSGDADLGGLAWLAAIHLADVRAQAAIPPPPVVFTADTSQVDAAVARLRSGTGSDGERMTALVTLLVAQAGAGGLTAGAHGIVGLARGGSAGRIVGPRQPVLIGEGLSREAVLPFDNFDDMTATIANSGAADDILRAAYAAGGTWGGVGAPGSSGAAAPMAGGAGGGDTYVTVAVTVQGNVTSERDLAAYIQEQLLRNTRQGRGLKLARSGS